MSQLSRHPQEELRDQATQQTLFLSWGIKVSYILRLSNLIFTLDYFEPKRSSKSIRLIPEYDDPWREEMMETVSGNADNSPQKGWVNTHSVGSVGACWTQLQHNAIESGKNWTDWYHINTQEFTGRQCGWLGVICSRLILNYMKTEILDERSEDDDQLSLSRPFSLLLWSWPRSEFVRNL